MRLNLIRGEVELLIEGLAEHREHTKTRDWDQRKVSWTRNRSWCIVSDECVALRDRLLKALGK